MSQRLRKLDAAGVEMLLRRYGFVLVSQRGSHRKWRNLASGLQVIVPAHKGRPLPTGTLRSILEGGQVPEHEWR